MDANETDRAIRAIQAAHRYGDEACRKLQAARAWAIAWKQAAKGWRADSIATEDMRQAAVGEMEWLYEENKRLRALIEGTAQTIEEYVDREAAQILRAALEATDGNDAG